MPSPSYREVFSSTFYDDDLVGPFQYPNFSNLFGCKSLLDETTLKALKLDVNIVKPAILQYLAYARRVATVTTKEKKPAKTKKNNITALSREAMQGLEHNGMNYFCDIWKYLQNRCFVDNGRTTTFQKWLHQVICNNRASAFHIKRDDPAATSSNSLFYVEKVLVQELFSSEALRFVAGWQRPIPQLAPCVQHLYYRAWDTDARAFTRIHKRVQRLQGQAEADLAGMFFLSQCITYFTCHFRLAITDVDKPDAALVSKAAGSFRAFSKAAVSLSERFGEDWTSEPDPLAIPTELDVAIKFRYLLSTYKDLHDYALKEASRSRKRKKTEATETNQPVVIREGGKNR